MAHLIEYASVCLCKLISSIIDDYCVTDVNLFCIFASWHKGRFAHCYQIRMTRFVQRALRPVYSDATQLDVELSSVELSCVARHPHRRNSTVAGDRQCN